VQLLSISAEGGADVRLRARGTIRWQFETRDSLPVVVLEPQIRTADVQLVDFDLRRISQLHGPVVEELGRGLRHELENELQARQEDLVGAINRELNRKRSRLTFSLAELLTSPWSRLLRPS
jgi:hypothetical protein